MDNSKATVSILFDTRRKKKDNTYPVRLTVYFDGQKARYFTGIDLCKEQWDKLNGPNLRDDRLREVKRKIEKWVLKAETIIRSMDSFSFTEFKSLFFDEKQVRRSSKLQDAFDTYISELERKDQIGTSISYRTTINSINSFMSGLLLKDITKEFLHNYERYISEKGLSPTTAGIHLRQLRRIINVAINQGLFDITKYPFRGFVIPASRNIKKALNPDQIRLLLNYQTDDPNRRKALDYWIFSYISNGINMTDICLLKPSDLDHDFFYFIRSKTKNTRKRDLRPIKVPLTDLSKAIIERQRTKAQSEYLFPILVKGLNARQIKFKIQDFIYFVNKHMKAIAGDLGIEQPVGTYVARHSHSTMLKRLGAPTELIKENLGHSSVLVTENYLADFTDEVKQDFSKLLVNF